MGQQTYKHVMNLQQFQSVNEFGCHCTYIATDEFKLTTNVAYCNETDQLTSLVQVKFPINLPYLTRVLLSRRAVEYFCGYSFK